jgi:hypothetical protein
MINPALSALRGLHARGVSAGLLVVIGGSSNDALAGILDEYLAGPPPWHGVELGNRFGV